MELDQRCLKIDRPNAYAMINGYMKNGEIIHQSIWCAVADYPFPMLLTLNRSNTKYKLSTPYSQQKLDDFSIPYKFIAILDSEYFIQNDLRLWQKLCNNGLFDIWDPASPYTRFDKSKSHPSKYRIQLLRIYEINEKFEDSDVVFPSDRIDHLRTSQRKVTIKKPVINDKDFLFLKSNLIKSVEEFLYTNRI